MRDVKSKKFGIQLFLTNNLILGLPISKLLQDSMKKTRLYARFLLISFDKCREVQRVFEHCAIPPCAGIIFLLAKTLHCNSATLLFLHNLN